MLPALCHRTIRLEYSRTYTYSPCDSIELNNNSGVKQTANSREDVKPIDHNIVKALERVTRVNQIGHFSVISTLDYTVKCCLIKNDYALSYCQWCSGAGTHGNGVPT